MLGATYCSAPRTLIDSGLFTDCIAEPPVLKSLHNVQRRVLFVDSCSAHKLTKEAKGTLQNSKTELRFSHECATDLVQPAEPFLIKAIKVV